MTCGTVLAGGNAAYVAEAVTAGGQRAVLKIALPPGIDRPRASSLSAPALASLAWQARRRMRTIGMAGPRVCDFCCRGLGSLEHLPGDRWWLAPGEDPAGEGGGNGNAEDGDGEVEDGRVAEGAEVAEVSGG